ncbi:MAG: hypothetical protein HY698_16315 [Deltaproteobacteria bacterium]|nr:hypothetical protein [Deltaproteobacteria bacterium]
MEGEILLPTKGVEEPPRKYLGFVAPIKNPITPIRPLDPRPECFVFLEGGPEAPGAKKPADSPVVMELGTVSFHVPVLPVVVGSTVEIKNVGKTTHPIHAPDKKDLFEGPPIGTGGVRSATLQVPEVAALLLSRDSPHVEGRIVALPTRYFARLSASGSFKIEDVPEGKWTIKVWYRDGWLPITSTVQVSGKGTKIRLTLPERMEVQASQESQEPKTGSAAGK